MAKGNYSRYLVFYIPRLISCNEIARRILMLDATGTKSENALAMYDVNHPLLLAAGTA
jgi:hypothetical protein